MVCILVVAIVSASPPPLRAEVSFQGLTRIVSRSSLLTRWQFYIGLTLKHTSQINMETAYQQSFVAFLQNTRSTNKRCC